MTQLENPDLMHYETRAIREQLKASTSRLSSAKHQVRPDLMPVQTDLMLEEWQRLSVQTDVDKDNTLASGHPQYEQMRAALLRFEHHSHYNATAKERSFWSALRTLLSEIIVESKPEEREMKLTAAFKWFTKHRPRGAGDDPAASAVLATSLSISSLAKPERSTTSTSAKPLSTQGTKHEFFGVYSKEPPATAPQLGMGLPSTSGRGAALRPGSSGRGSATQAAGAAAARMVGGGRPLDMHVVMHPAVHKPSEATLATRAAAAAAAAATAQRREALQRKKAAEAEDAAAADSAASTSGPTVAGPKGVLRKLDPSSTTGKQPSWVSGPFKGDTKRVAPLGSSMAGLSAASATRVASWQAHVEAAGQAAETEEEGEEEEVRKLRVKWQMMDERSSRSFQDVQAQVNEWSKQRARLEEEIMRRQEASRFASPSAALAARAGSAGGPATRGAADDVLDSNPQTKSYLSPYASLPAESMAQTNSGHIPPGMALPYGVGSIAKDVRQANIAEYRRDKAYLMQRVHQLGVEVSVETLSRGLAPVPDKPYLECVAKLPQPGQELESRPGGAGKALRKPGSASKKGGRSKSARPASGGKAK